ncbi:HEPN/Toprim-associated domain-containing protein [Flavobacterium sp. ov086]|uniref:HEPN/Toprim-associated domain-containing protein n=1 Tax=Flavobacterium sp. ov086 TaxID=1761785 RepID=UPI000B66AD08|nr:HEPN/Toprim-associated domain-containing protein [Flavobacterium sp. ov086]SNR97929.1 hypothetical protein SAMN04487979_13721 [Flavobacterium sp. ov086]
MGSFCTLALNGYEIDQSKSYISTSWSCFFTEEDRRSRMVPYQTYYSSPIADDDNVPTCEYAASASAIKLRLEIMGYTLDKVKRKYSEGIENALLTRAQFDCEDDIDHLNTLKNGGFGYWVALIKHIFENNITDYSENLEQQEGIVRFMLEVDDIHQDIYLGYPNIGIGYVLRGLLEAADPDSELVLDLTDVVYSGYYGEKEPVCAHTAQSYLDSSLPFQKIIILTEGASDSKILMKALRLLYPQVSNYFSFLDFDDYKAEGGSAMLEKTVKSFAAAGISNKIIALFDYDAAGLASFQRLKKIKFPENFRIISLPPIELADSYPTIGSDGMIKHENVNGCACSIEMYLGIDILADDAGHLAPVKWRSIEPQLKIFQGEISGKARLQKNYFKKAKAAQKKEALQSDQDWSGLISVFERIFEAAATMDHAPTPLKYI